MWARSVYEKTFARQLAVGKRLFRLSWSSSGNCGNVSIYKYVCWGFFSLLFACSALKFPSKKYGEQKEQFLRHCEICNEDYIHWSIPRERICQNPKVRLAFHQTSLFIVRDVDVDVDVESISYLYIKFLSKNTPLPNILALYVYFCRQCYKSRI